MLKLCVLLLGIFICVTESTICTSHDAISKQIKKNCDKHSSILSNLPLGNIAVSGLLPRQKIVLLDTDIEKVVLQLNDTASKRYTVFVHAVSNVSISQLIRADFEIKLTFDDTFNVKGGAVSLATDMDTLEVSLKIKRVPRRSQTIPADFLLQIKEKLIAPCKDLMKIVIDTCNEQNKKFKAVYILGNNLQCHNEITSIESKPGYLVSSVTTFIGCNKITWDSTPYEMMEGQLHSISVHKNVLNVIVPFLGLVEKVFDQEIDKTAWKELDIFKDAEGQGPVRIKVSLKSSPVSNISASGLVLELVLEVEVYNYLNTLIDVEVNAAAKADLTYSDGHIGIVTNGKVIIDPNMKVISTHKNCGCPDVITTVSELIKQFVNRFWDQFKCKLKVKIPLALPVGTPGTPVTPGPVTPCKPHPVHKATSSSMQSSGYYNHWLVSHRQRCYKFPLPYILYIDTYWTDSWDSDGDMSNQHNINSIQKNRTKLLGVLEDLSDLQISVKITVLVHNRAS